MEFLLKRLLWQHPSRNETHKQTYINLNQFLGIVVPRSRDGRMEGSPGRLMIFAFFIHPEGWVVFSL